jgi:hypothetical protein
MFDRLRKPWKHHRQCAYCIEQGFPADYKEGGCKHFRGGKTHRKRVRKPNDE